MEQDDKPVTATLIVDGVEYEATGDTPAEARKNVADKARRAWRRLHPLIGDGI